MPSAATSWSGNPESPPPPPTGRTGPAGDAGDDPSYFGIARGAGRFFAVPTDGIDREIHDTGTTEYIHAAAFGDGRWVMVGREGPVVTSTNLDICQEQVITWDAEDPVWLEGIPFWAVGGQGDILQSGQVADPPEFSILPSQTANEVLLQVRGTAGTRWDILYSPDLTPGNWSKLNTISLETEPEILGDPVPGNRFHLLSEPE